MMKVIVTDEISEQGLELLLQEPRVQLDVRLGLNKAELHRIIGDYDAIITRSGTQVDAELLEHAKQLKIVARAGVGIDNVDVPAASERGIIVVNAPFGNTNSAAEHSMAILLAMCRNVPVANASLKSGQWQTPANQTGSAASTGLRCILRTLKHRIVTPGWRRKLSTSSLTDALSDRDLDKWLEQLVQTSLCAWRSPLFWQLHHPNALIRGIQ